MFGSIRTVCLFKFVLYVGAEELIEICLGEILTDNIHIQNIYYHHKCLNCRVIKPFVHTNVTVFVAMGLNGTTEGRCERELCVDAMKCAHCSLIFVTQHYL